VEETCRSYMGVSRIVYVSKSSQCCVCSRAGSYLSRRTCVLCMVTGTLVEHDALCYVLCATKCACACVCVHVFVGVCVCISLHVVLHPRSVAPDHEGYQLEGVL
jgi:hypothetical protein